MIDPKKLLKQLRMYERFRSLTKAIQMVALSQLSSLKTKIESRQYALSAFKPFFTPIFEQEVGSEYLVVPIAVDKSCCGPHNGNIFKATKEILDDLKENNYSFKIVSIGRRAKNFFKKYYKNYQIMNI
jgi:F0F1-type ATP synthase gamma subunit